MSSEEATQRLLESLDARLKKLERFVLQLKQQDKLRRQIKRERSGV